MPETTAAGEPTGGEGLQVLFGSSGEAETAAIIASAERFTEATGTPVDVIPAQDLRQQLTQAFAGGSPPDVFYLSPEEARTFQDSLFPYGDQIEDIDDFYPALLESYTIDDQLYCVPKDFSNLALVINTTAWEAAGLTDDDIPTTWDELTAISTQLTSGEQTGLVFGGEIERIGAFLRQAGGWIVNEDMTEATAESDEHREALTYVQDNVLAGNFQYAAHVEAGWGGEAFGTGKGAMTIEGPWIVGALQNDFPDVSWQAAELPEGPAGPGTLTFSNCWGIAADGDTANTVELVRHFASARGAADLHRGVRCQPVTDQPRGVERRGPAREGRLQRRDRLRPGAGRNSGVCVGDRRPQRPAREPGKWHRDAR